VVNVVQNCGAHKTLKEGSIKKEGETKPIGSSCGQCGANCGAHNQDLEVRELTKEEKLKNWHGTIDLVKHLYGDNWANSE